MRNQKPRTRLDRRGKLVFWFMLLTLVAVVVYLATSV